MSNEEIIKGVLELYVGSQINIDSLAAREQLAVHIAAELESKKDWNTIHGDSEYSEFRFTDDDLHV